MVRVGVIGGGFIGQEHIAALLGAGAKVEALAEPRKRMREALARKFGIPRQYADGAELAASAGLDAVAVCSPNYLHCAHTLAALRNGKHVLCEKPMAVNAEEAARMVKAARKAGLLLMMGFNQRFDAGIAEIVRLAEGGEFGDIFYGRSAQIRRYGPPTGAARWFRHARTAGAGVVFDLGSHAFYRAWYAMGRPEPVRVFAKTYRAYVDGQVDDFASALVTFSGGKSLHLEVSWAAPRPDEGKVTIVMGFAGGAFYRTEGNELLLFRKERGTIRQRRVRLARTVTSKYGHFVRCIRGEAECLCPGEHGYVVQCVLDAMVESSRSGRQAPVRSGASAGDGG